MEIEITEMTILSPKTMAVVFTEAGRRERRTAQWTDEEAVRAVREAAKLSSGADGASRLVGHRIPARAELGSDQIHDVAIHWDRDFPWKDLLLTTWVMLT